MYALSPWAAVVGFWHTDVGCGGRIFKKKSIFEALMKRRTINT
jgi:hypothetical protein